MPDSAAQVRLAHAVAQGGARNSSMSAAVAKEIIAKMHGRKMSKLPEHVGGRKKRKKGLFGR